jgi:HSP20 family protein
MAERLVGHTVELVTTGGGAARAWPPHGKEGEMSTTISTRGPGFGFADLRERLDRVMEELIEGHNGHRLAVDVVDEPERFVLRADIPGLTPEEVEVEVKDDVLTISAAHEETEEDKQDHYVRRERRYGSFSRSMTLPRGVDADAVEAIVSDGVLEVTVPKPAPGEQDGQTVEIQAKGG